jgi:hypothetical protein
MLLIRGGMFVMALIVLRMPRRRLLFGSRRVKSNHGSPPSTTGSTRSREYNEIHGKHSKNGGHVMLITFNYVL